MVIIVLVHQFSNETSIWNAFEVKHVIQGSEWFEFGYHFFAIDYKQFVQTRGKLDGSLSPSLEQGPRGATAHHRGARPRHPPTTYDDATFNKKLRHMGKSMYQKVLNAMASFSFVYSVCGAFRFPFFSGIKLF